MKLVFPTQLCSERFQRQLLISINKHWLGNPSVWIFFLFPHFSDCRCLWNGSVVSRLTLDSRRLTSLNGSGNVVKNSKRLFVGLLLLNSSWNWIRKSKRFHRTCSSVELPPCFAYLMCRNGLSLISFSCLLAEHNNQPLKLSVRPVQKEIPKLTKPKKTLE